MDEISISSSVRDLFLDLAEEDDISLVSFPEEYETESGNRSKISRCIITAFVPEVDDKFLKPEHWFQNPDHVCNWVGQFEECPQTERLHVQIYVEFKHDHRPRFGMLKNLIRTITGKPGDIAVSKVCTARQRQMAVNYCSKPFSRYHETTPFFWEKNKDNLRFDSKSYKNNKEDLKTQQVKYINSKPIYWTWDQIVHENEESQILLAACSWGAKFHAGRHTQMERRIIKNVIILYGAGGTGKTTMALNWDVREEEHQSLRYYKRNADDGKFWGGGRTAYKGQRIIHLEEFNGSETAGNFKELCDIGKVGPSVNIKNSGTELNHETVIITSNHHPAGWYKNLLDEDDKQWNPICRRFTKVYFFPEFKPDGSRNIPDDDNEPFYHDQTETFTSRSMRESFEVAKAHADEFWPIKEAKQKRTLEDVYSSDFYRYATTGNFN